MPLKKNTSLNRKDTQLTTLFKDHFSGYLQLQRVRVIYMIINALCKVRSVNFSKLSLDMTIKQSLQVIIDAFKGFLLK